MKTVWLIFIVLILYFFGCSNDNNVPKGLLSEDSLVRIIVDMHLADAILIDPLVQQKQFVINKTKFYNAVLKKHCLTKEEFQKNINFYSDNPDRFDKVYEKVIEELTILQGNLLNPDSLKAKPVK
jgi:hypothetical protein